MKNSRITASLLTLACIASAPMAVFAAETVEFNKTHVMRLNAPAGAIVVGNPKIADVSVHSDNTLFVFGRGFGQTDILVLDAAGNTLVHTDINVVESSRAGVVRILTPGEDSKTYDCSPYCRPAPGFGNDPEFKGKFTGEAAASTGATAGISGAGLLPSSQLTGGSQAQSAFTEFERSEDESR